MGEYLGRCQKSKLKLISLFVVNAFITVVNKKANCIFCMRVYTYDACTHLYISIWEMLLATTLF